jgi:hypothetical protein
MIFAGQFSLFPAIPDLLSHPLRIYVSVRGNIRDYHPEQVEGRLCSGGVMTKMGWILKK